MALPFDEDGGTSAQKQRRERGGAAYGELGQVPEVTVPAGVVTWVQPFTELTSTPPEVVTVEPLGPVLTVAPGVVTEDPSLPVITVVPGVVADAPLELVVVVVVPFESVVVVVPPPLLSVTDEVLLVVVLSCTVPVEDPLMLVRPVADALPEAPVSLTFDELFDCCVYDGADPKLALVPLLEARIFAVFSLVASVQPQPALVELFASVVVR